MNISQRFFNKARINVKRISTVTVAMGVMIFYLPSVAGASGPLGYYSGQITDTHNNPLSNITVYLSGNSPGKTTTDSNGNYSIPIYAAGNEYVSVFNNAHPFNTSINGFTIYYQTEYLTGSQTQNLQLPDFLAATDTVSVVNENNLALANVPVSLNQVDYNMSSPGMPAAYQLMVGSVGQTTDTNGHVTFNVFKDPGTHLEDGLTVNTATTPNISNFISTNVTGNVTQNLHVNGSLLTGDPPQINVGQPYSFVFGITASPLSTASESGRLPKGVTFNYSNGIVSLSGTVKKQNGKKYKVYPITITTTDIYGTTEAANYQLVVSK